MKNKKPKFPFVRYKDLLNTSTSFGKVIPYEKKAYFKIKFGLDKADFEFLDIILDGTGSGHHPMSLTQVLAGAYTLTSLSTAKRSLTLLREAQIVLVDEEDKPKGEKGAAGTIFYLNAEMVYAPLIPEQAEEVSNAIVSKLEEIKKKKMASPKGLSQNINGNRIKIICYPVDGVFTLQGLPCTKEQWEMEQRRKWLSYDEVKFINHSEVL